MNKKIVVTAAVIAIAASVFAETNTKAENGEIRDGSWKFPSITGPSRSDLAQSAKITVAAGQLHKDGAPVTALADGIVGNTFTPFGNLEEIVLVFKSHFDIGYTHMAREAVQGYRTTMIDHALEVVDQNKNLPTEQQFVWTIPGWPMKKILEDWPGQTKQRQERVRAAFKEGRFAAHALPFSMQTEMMEPEGMVRALDFSAQLAREAGRPLPTGAKMTDVPSHSWILPMLLKNSGVNFLHIGCNPASSSPRVPLLFWWEGPDGSRLLTM